MKQTKTVKLPTLQTAMSGNNRLLVQQKCTTNDKTTFLSHKTGLFLLPAPMEQLVSLALYAVQQKLLQLTFKHCYYVR